MNLHFTHRHRAAAIAAAIALLLYSSGGVASGSAVNITSASETRRTARDR